MIRIEQIKNYFPLQIRENRQFDKYILKEYIQLMILDYLSTSVYIQKISFIGGTCLRLTKGIDRFSEDLDFDCSNFSQSDFTEMTDGIIRFLSRSGFQIETRDKANPNLSAFRRNIYFPEFLFNMGLSGHKDERFLIKIESQDQGIDYKTVMTEIKGCGYFFPFPVPSDGVLCSMKIAALLGRAKGRDFYDLMFVLQQTKPDYRFLSQKTGIHNLTELKEAIGKLLETTDLRKKQKDFEHLLFSKTDNVKILHFSSFINTLQE